MFYLSAEFISVSPDVLTHTSMEAMPADSRPPSVMPEVPGTVPGSPTHSALNPLSSSGKGGLHLHLPTTSGASTVVASLHTSTEALAPDLRPPSEIPSVRGSDDAVDSPQVLFRAIPCGFLLFLTLIVLFLRVLP